MKLQKRLRFELSRIADEECYDFGAHQLMMLRQDEARELRAYLDAAEARIKRLEEALRTFALKYCDECSCEAGKNSDCDYGRAREAMK